jgi:predicted phosphohydrolase
MKQNLEFLAKNENMKFQIISDLHIEKGNHPKNYITPHENATLIVAGDVGRIENYDKYVETLQWMCDSFEKVLIVPGNHEYYSENPRLTYNKINKIFRKLEAKFDNLRFLINEDLILGKLVIFGSTFWSYCPHQYFNNIPIYNEDGTLITSGDYNGFHQSSQRALESRIDYCTRMKFDLLVITHHAPTFYETLGSKHRNSEDTKNYMYCSSSDLLLKNSVIKYWVYGHTGYNGTYDKLVSNQVDLQNFSKQKIITL